MIFEKKGDWSPSESYVIISAPLGLAHEHHNTELSEVSHFNLKLYQWAAGWRSINDNSTFWRKYPEMWSDKSVSLIFELQSVPRNHWMAVKYSKGH